MVANKHKNPINKQLRLIESVDRMRSQKVEKLAKAKNDANHAIAVTEQARARAEEAEIMLQKATDEMEQAQKRMERAKKKVKVAGVEIERAEELRVKADEDLVKAERKLGKVEEKYRALIGDLNKLGQNKGKFTVVTSKNMNSIVDLVKSGENLSVPVEVPFSVAETEGYRAYVALTKFAEDNGVPLLK